MKRFAYLPSMEELDQASLAGAFWLRANGPSTAKVVTGGAGNNVLTGTAGDDTITDPGGTNTLNGLEGNDKLTGGKDTDTLNGGDGADILNGGKGNDALTGGAGTDQFTVNTKAFGADTVTDFQNGVDKIRVQNVAGWDDFSDVVVSSNGSGWAVITFNDGSTITLTGTVASDVDASDFLWI